MQIDKESSKEKVPLGENNENPHALINVICQKLQSICTLTYQITYPKIQTKKIKRKRLYLKKRKDCKTKISKIGVKTNQCFCQICSDFKLLEYISQLSAVENLQNQLDQVKQMVYLFD
ncbi:unnamed protein product (macronuclear) [Paramecium tetraurelia]|uniref:Uncharacterized protein n=1 Tax=Paramecium tetraurelia TaxID=5888 RepID=A0CVF4_PARTE|nr:uncharacterized protein GSPATT00010939001 [Paramecium tetraurelia]CAK74771.1 unnamed protein product [Paramecium tetraurelia]|eukprot:XP_001442168.1 hypothetical protein (macronuclear) [Paramecium tetraurelia strain d4-2]